MRWLEHRLPPPLLALLLGWAMQASAAWPPALPWPRAVAWPLMAGLVLAGLACDLGGLTRFLRVRTTINPLRPQNSSVLVTDGIYRFTRNPMYLGLVLLLSAWAVHLQAVWPWAGPLVFVAYITRFQILPEERALRARFGPEYRAYCERVRRWL